MFHRLFSGNAKARLRIAAEIEMLRKSCLLDPVWYRENYPDIRHTPIDVAQHYLTYGAAEGRNPNPSFDTRFYLEQNPDVAAAGVNPLVHYIQHGQKEGRRTRGVEFDPDFYSALYPDVQRTNLTPLEHFQRIGKQKCFHPAFDEDWYRAEYPDLATVQGSLRSHFLNIGKNEGRHPAFHYQWYVREYPNVLGSRLDPLEHYRRYGRREGRHAGFDRIFYLNEYPDISNSQNDPYEHFDNHGRREGRYPAFNRAWYLSAYKDIGRSKLDPYEHYSRAGRAEGRPLTPDSFRHITPWGHLNSNSEANAPATLDGRVPEADEAFAPKVSIIVPNYNHARFLSERLNSIYSQTYRKFEVILLDDASSDDSVAVLRQFAGLHSDRTTCYFNTTNSGGVFHQWKRGLQVASGDLIWIAESDDFCSSDFLSELVRFFRNSAVMLAFSRTDFVLGSPPNRTWTSEAYWSEIGFDLGSEPVIVSAHELVRSAWGARNIAPNVSGVVFRNPGNLAILEDQEWLRLRMCGDWVFYLAIIRGGLVGYSPFVTNFYRQHPQNTSIGTHDKDLYYEEHEITARYLAKLYRVTESDLRRHEEVLYRHWCMKRGSEARIQFEALFDIEKVKLEGQSRKLNVAIAIYALVPGGGETFPILVANLLSMRGYCVTVLNFEREKTNAGIKSTLGRSIPIIEPENSAESGALLARLGVELVHSHHAWADITLAIALKSFPDIRHIVTMHGMYELLQPHDLRHFETDLETVDAFVYIADKNLGHLSNEFSAQKSFVKITNTVALSPLSGLSREELRIKETEFVLCLASRAVAEKGWDEAVQAVVSANERSKCLIRLLLVGDGPEFDRLSKLSLPPFITLLGFQTNVRDFFAIADVGLIASRFRGESCPLVLIECLSVGKPVISSDVGEVRNMLMGDDGLAGVLHTLTDWTVNVQKLSNIIRDLANNRSAYQRILDRVPIASAKFNPDQMIDQYIDLYNNVVAGRKGRSEGSVRLSVVLVAFNMARELRRTIRTLSADYQRIATTYYEIIVVDNGSTCTYDMDELYSICPNLRFLRMEHPNHSPVDALNHGIALARGAVICVCIDAARMASPQLLRLGMSACELRPHTVVGSLSYHLGYEAQNESAQKGYDQAVEDELLRTVDWQANGYSLYNIASFDPSSRFGLYSCPAESNALFMRREDWADCGGVDSAFRSRGGGLANLDLWRRLCEDDRNLLVILLGEGTFHQFHGGVATNAAEDRWVEFHKEYVGIRGVEFRVPSRKPFLFGKMNPWIAEFENRVQNGRHPDAEKLS